VLAAGCAMAVRWNWSMLSPFSSATKISFLFMAKVFVHSCDTEKPRFLSRRARISLGIRLTGFIRG